MFPQSKEVKPRSAPPSILNKLAAILKALSSIPDFLETVYLFTHNDFATFAIPTTLFATFGSLSGPLLTKNSSPSLLSILSRLPLALAVIWANLLIFNISNQRSETAVEEDKINKPHRPLPSGRITCLGARRLLLVTVPLVLLLGFATGTWTETLLLFTATWMYNDLGGSDESWIGRNLMIAIGYGLYSCAALRVMTGVEHQLGPQGYQWLAIITLVMFTTQHICDIKDAEGDRERGRKSAPIVLGDEVVRWSVAVPIVLASFACPFFFGLGISGYVPCWVLGQVVAVRTLTFRTLQADKLTWKLWALWTVSLFALPLMENHEVLGEAWVGLKGVVCDGGYCESKMDLVAVVVEGGKILGQMDVGGNRTMMPELRADGMIVG